MTGLALALGCGDPTDACPPALSGTEAASIVTDSGRGEQPDLAGDFDLLDPASNTTPSLEGLVPTLSDLPIPLTKLTMRYVEQFGTTDKGRQTFFDRFHRAGKYRDHIERKLRDRDLPDDLLWLVAIESGFKAQAVSPAGAAGLFQFMPKTGERFGLSIAEDRDERRSVAKATDAAIAYLTILYEQFGSWDLALAAYNCGEGRLLEALNRARNQLKLPPDAVVPFHELAAQKLLPRETAHYVPMIHAFAIVAQNRELLTLDDADPIEPLRFAEIAVASGTRLGLIAKAADISIADLREYNPDFLTDRVPGARGDQLVQLPVDALEQTLAALPALIERENERPAGASVSSVIVDAVVDETKDEPKKSEKKKKKTPAGEDVLQRASGRPDTYLLSNGLFVELKEEALDVVEIDARIEVVDPTNGRKPIGKRHSVEARKVKATELDGALASLQKDLHRLLLGDAADELRLHVANRRRGFHARRGQLDLFSALSQRAFPASHPMHGALLAGTTERDDDPFLELEPTWALETTVTIRGTGVTPEQLGPKLESAFAPVFLPTKRVVLAPSARAVVGEGAREIVVAWSTPPPTVDAEAATHLAFLLACHPKIGVAHKALRHGRSIAAGVSCALELAPQGAVGWIVATPIEPATVHDAEKAVDAAIAKLIAHGPTDAELDTARRMLRTVLARDRETARLRGVPKSWVTSSSRRIRARIKQVDTVDVMTAAKALFAKDHKIVVTGG